MTALGLAKCGFGAQLVDALTNYHNQKLSAEAWDNFLVQWHAEMQHELINNSSRTLSHCYAKLSLQLPETFPSPAALQLYSAPLISESFPNSSSWYEICEPMIVGIAKFCSDKFHWSTEKAKKKFLASLWDGIFLQLLYFVSFLFFIQFVEYLLTHEHCGKA